MARFRNPDLIGFAGAWQDGAFLVFKVALDPPVQDGVDEEGNPIFKYHAEKRIPAALFMQDIDRTNPALNAAFGLPPTFAIHVQRWRVGPGDPWQYDIVYGTRPEDGEWPHERLPEVEADLGGGRG